MIPKDYYKIMDVKPSATTVEIKRSYRRLAMKYHPDKNQGDAIAEATFRAIAEAYSILANPQTRLQYDYEHVQVYKQKQPVEITNESLLKDIAKLQKIVASSDPFRINQDALYFQLTQVLSPAVMQMLATKHNVTFNRQVIEQLLQCSKPLNFNFTQKISVPLLQIAGDDETAQSSINAFVQTAYRNNQWNRYKPWIAVAIALLLCLLIFLLK